MSRCVPARYWCTGTDRPNWADTVQCASDEGIARSRSGQGVQFGASSKPSDHSRLLPSEADDGGPDETSQAARAQPASLSLSSRSARRPARSLDPPNGGRRW